MIKKIIFLFILVFCCFHFLAANPVRKTVQFGGYEREYLLYIPENAEKPQGIIVCLHGFNRTMQDFFNTYNITKIADQLNYIILAPQALSEQGADVVLLAESFKAFGYDIPLESAWGCGTKVSAKILLSSISAELNKDIDDAGFIGEIIRTTFESNNLQTQDVFAFGTSLGGFMSYQLALTPGIELKGIISVAGSMGRAIRNKDNPVKVPVCDFHSLTDEVIPYDESMTISAGIFSATVELAWPKSKVLDFWVEKNGITSLPKIENVNYYPSNNGITVEKITYPDAKNEVIHYKANGADHGYFFIKEKGDCMDMQEEITRFILAHASSNPSGVETPDFAQRIFYPNPIQDNIRFSIDEGSFSLLTVDGKIVLSDSFTSGEYNLSSLNKGLYIIRVHNGNRIYTRKLIKQ